MWKLYYKNREVIPAEKILQENIEAKKDIYGIVRWGKKKKKKLNEIKSDEIAEDYGSLSEILVEKYRLEEALELRQKSIEIKKNLNRPTIGKYQTWIWII